MLEFRIEIQFSYRISLAIILLVQPTAAHYRLSQFMELSIIKVTVESKTCAFLSFFYLQVKPQASKSNHKVVEKLEIYDFKK